MEEKQLRLGHLTWLEAHACRASFLVTRAAPPLCFLPAVLCSATEAALAARQAESELEAQQADARLDAALESAARAAAAKEAKLLGNARAAAEDNVSAEPVSLKARRGAERCSYEDKEDADDAVEDVADEAVPSSLAGVLDVQDT